MLWFSPAFASGGFLLFVGCFLCASGGLELGVFDDGFGFAAEVGLHGESFGGDEAEGGEFYFQTVHEGVEGVAVACGGLLVADAQFSLGYDVGKEVFELVAKVCGGGFQTLLDGGVFIDVGGALCELAVLDLEFCRYVCEVLLKGFLCVF